MKKTTRALFKAVSVFGTICIGCGITSVIEYGANIHTVGLIIASTAVAGLYKLVVWAENNGIDIELDD